MPLLYPAASPTLAGDVLTINRFLRSPALVARRLRSLAEQRFIADAILTARLPVAGGATMYEADEGIYSDRNVGAVAPGGEYPLTTVGTGPASIASTVKWGEDSLVTDEAIKRQLMNPVDRALVKMVNQTVKHVDGVALSAVSSAVSASTPAAAAWATATAEQIITDVMVGGVAPIRALNQGYEPDTVIVDDARWAYAMSKFIAAGLTPRESATTPLLTGEFPTILGMRWLATPNLPTSGQAIVLDSDNLGGMADEDLESPGYVRGTDGVGVEAKTMREDEQDRWLLRCRRVTVPIVQNPGAARKITGVGA
jgi:hypothetical protein